jgi:hypothetical protein
LPAPVLVTKNVMPAFAESEARVPDVIGISAQPAVASAISDITPTPVRVIVVLSVVVVGCCETE